AQHLGDLEAEAPARIAQSVTPRTREQVLARDGYACRVPGCRSQRHLEIHHLDPQCDGGGHHTSNLLTICDGHHQHEHDGTLVITGTHERDAVFTWPSDPNRASTRDRHFDPCPVGTTSSCPVGTAPLSLEDVARAAE